MLAVMILVTTSWAIGLIFRRALKKATMTTLYMLPHLEGQDLEL